MRLLQFRVVPCVGIIGGIWVGASFNDIINKFTGHGFAIVDEKETWCKMKRGSKRWNAVCFTFSRFHADAIIKESKTGITVIVKFKSYWHFWNQYIDRKLAFKEYARITGFNLRN